MSTIDNTIQGKLNFINCDGYWFIMSYFPVGQPITVVPHSSYAMVLCGGKVYNRQQSKMPGLLDLENAEVLMNEDGSGIKWIVAVPSKKFSQESHAIHRLNQIGFENVHRYSAPSETHDPVNPHRSYTFGLAVE